LEVPLVGAVQALARRSFTASSLTVVRPSGAGPLELCAEADNGSRVIVEMYGPNQRSGGALSQVWRKITLRNDETGPLQTSMRRAVEHRGLITIAVSELGLANTKTLTVASLDRGWTLIARTPVRGQVLTDQTPVQKVWNALSMLHNHQISHGDLRASEITVDDDAVLFGGLESAEYGASDVQLQSDMAQLLVTTTELYGAEPAVAAAIESFDKDVVLTASGRLTKSAVPQRLREGIPDASKVIAAARDEVQRQTGADKIQTETITRFTRNQVIQLVLMVGLVYVAYPFISAVPTFFSELRTANWWWALLGLVVSGLTYVGAAAALWACASEAVNFRKLAIMQVANTFAATTTPAGVGGLALSTRFLQKAGLGTVRATAAVAMQQTVQVLTHVALLILLSAVAGVSANLSHFVPSATALYLIAGAALGVVGAFMLVPRARHWLGTSLRPRLAEVWADLITLAREPRRLGLVILGCGATTLGAALVLWASIEAFGGTTSFVTVCVVTMIGGTLASAAPTPGGVGAVEAALIGGLAAFGLPAAVAVPSVLLYRVLTCWLPVFIGWPVMRWLTQNDMI
ncbi:MAG: lysylphosphatidylglycerol synthase transmembrane domain-containing protein, partial [Mycobacterium sp.]